MEAVEVDQIELCPHHHQADSLCACFHKQWWKVRKEFEEANGLSVAKSCFTDRVRYQKLAHG